MSKIPSHRAAKAPARAAQTKVVKTPPPAKPERTANAVRGRGRKDQPDAADAS